MRLILIGMEYTGKTTLSQGLMDWGHENGIHHHLDDHFSIPDCQMLKSEEDQKIMTGLPDVLKERFQRFHIEDGTGLFSGKDPGSAGAEDCGWMAEGFGPSGAARRSGGRLSEAMSAVYRDGRGRAGGGQSRAG